MVSHSFVCWLAQILMPTAPERYHGGRGVALQLSDFVTLFNNRTPEGVYAIKKKR
jgi:hypothetical protein